MDCELLAPAGDFETALAALAAGADAVYCGLTEFSARAFAKNFTLKDLKSLLRLAHATSADRPQPRRVYVTFNTVVDEDRLESAIEELAELEAVHPDALIVQDLGVARLCRRHFPTLELHASTQLVAHNLEGVLALKELGFKRVVLARELSLEEIVSIAKRCGEVELEVFIHGALCYSLSGLCLFGAMEKGRSGNRGQCPYCCREERKAEVRYPFSMKDLRLGDMVKKLAEAGVASLKIEGRMKSPLYVASVTKYYRQILGARDAGWADWENGNRKGEITETDLETVFSRRTTELYFQGRPRPGFQPVSPIDPVSLGHLGAEIGVVKKVTKDRDGLSWLRFHTSRGLEKHDGLQFDAMANGRHLGLGVSEMRQAISRRPVFEVNAGVDVEILLPNAGETKLTEILKPGMKIYLSMSNAVKRKFPAQSFRPSDYEGTQPVEVEVKLSATETAARVLGPESLVRQLDAALPAVKIQGDFPSAKTPEKTFESVRKAFSKLRETDYRLGRLEVIDPQCRFVPMNVLNDLRRDLVERLEEARDQARRKKTEAALSALAQVEARGTMEASALATVKLREDQRLPPGEWDELIVAINQLSDPAAERFQAIRAQGSAAKLRLALPVYTAEPEFNRLRSTVKRFLRSGYDRWEASDLATLRMLKALGVTDLTADWTLYAFNSQALKTLFELGVRRMVASPENSRENLQFLAESGYAIEFLKQQSTPLFISLTAPAAEPEELAVYRRDGLWVTTRLAPRTFEIPAGGGERLDLSWDPTF